MSYPQTPAHRLSALLVAGRRWVVLAMLVALHAALVSEPGGAFQRLWLLVHFGLFLLWQPFYATERELDLLSVVLLVALTTATIYFVAGWMVITWMLLLLGILGGRVFTIQPARRTRFYLVAFAYVLAIMLVWAVPVLLLGARALPEDVAYFGQWLLPSMLVVLAFIPAPRETDSSQVFDFFYAVLVFQLVMVLVLGTLVLMRFADESYVNAVLLTVFGFALALLVFAALWNPMGGFGGLRTYFSSYLMSVGMPFELWMRRIAELAETQADAQRFLERALKEVALLPWISGCAWRSPDGAGRFGEEGEHATSFSQQSLEVVFHTRIPLSPALFLHMRLLAQVVGEFYEGKRRENALRRHAYLQAVHETGARLTHDVKNLLQSVYAITSAVPRGASAQEAYVALLQRQLPQLSKRLHATLEKLRSPELPTTEMLVRATTWWQEVERRLSGSDVPLRAAITADANIPAALFDSFVENALDNARAKALREPGVRMSVEFEFGAEGCRLAVCDTGSAVPEATAQRLFAEPIERGAGLGIGLYHLARMAAQAGFQVALDANRDGEVRFTLSAAQPSGGGKG